MPWTVEIDEQHARKKDFEIKRGYIRIVARFQQGNDRFVFRGRVKVDRSDENFFIQRALAAKAVSDRSSTDVSAIITAIQNGLNR